MSNQMIDLEKIHQDLAKLDGIIFDRQYCLAASIFDNWNEDPPYGLVMLLEHILESEEGLHLITGETLIGKDFNFDRYELHEKIAKEGWRGWLIEICADSREVFANIDGIYGIDCVGYQAHQRFIYVENLADAVEMAKKFVAEIEAAAWKRFREGY